MIKLKINSIKKMSSGKYKLNVGDITVTTYDDVIIKNGLLYNKNIDEQSLEKIKIDNEYYNAYNKTLSYIMKRQRCISEVKKYLKKFELSEGDEDKIIEHLKSIGVLNETTFVKSFISDSIYLSLSGPNKIKQQLLDMNIDECIIEDCLSKIDVSVIESNAIKLITKRFKSNHKYSEYQLKQKILIDMANLGYEKELVYTILDNFSFEDDSLLEKEYDKLFIKLSKKYSGNELRQKIKQKLYSKGFDVNKIIELIQKKES